MTSLDDLDEKNEFESLNLYVCSFAVGAVVACMVFLFKLMFSQL